MNYYNEIDPAAAAWLAALMARNLIPHGHIDTRSICEVTPGELKGYTQCHFFAGIGGWSLALQLAGWPESRPVWTGSPPCQDNSNAGAIWGVRTGLRGKRSGLAHRWLDLVGEIRPKTVFFENVPGIAPWIAEIQGRLEGFGYGISRSDSSAGDIGAPHLRRRVWMVADLNSKRLEIARVSRPSPALGAAWRTPPRNAWATAHPGTSRVANGVSGRMALIRAFGNAIVPQVAAQFIEAFLEVEKDHVAPFGQSQKRA